MNIIDLVFPISDMDLGSDDHNQVEEINANECDFNRLIKIYEEQVSNIKSTIQNIESRVSIFFVLFTAIIALGFDSDEYTLTRALALFYLFSSLWSLSQIIYPIMHTEISLRSYDEFFKHPNKKYKLSYLNDLREVNRSLLRTRKRNVIFLKVGIRRFYNFLGLFIIDKLFLDQLNFFYSQLFDYISRISIFFDMITSILPCYIQILFLII